MQLYYSWKANSVFARDRFKTVGHASKSGFIFCSGYRYQPSQEPASLQVSIQEKSRKHLQWSQSLWWDVTFSFLFWALWIWLPEFTSCLCSSSADYEGKLGWWVLNVSPTSSARNYMIRSEKLDLNPGRWKTLSGIELHFSANIQRILWKSFKFYLLTSRRFSVSALKCRSLIYFNLSLEQHETNASNCSLR